MCTQNHYNQSRVEVLLNRRAFKFNSNEFENIPMQGLLDKDGVHYKTLQHKGDTVVNEITSKKARTLLNKFHQGTTTRKIL